MAVFNEIDEGGLNGILSKRLGMPGGSPAPSLAPEIMPQLVLESDRPEWGWLKQEQLLSYTRFLAAGGAGNYGQWWFTNPADSGLIATVTDILCTAGPVDIKLANAVDPGAIVGTLDPSASRDTRWPSNGVLQIRYATLPLSVATYRTVAVINTGQIFTCALVLSPGTTLYLHGAVNTAVRPVVCWRERSANIGELV